MDELQQLEAAIRVLESQRALLGEGVVETALQPLREKLAALQREQAARQRKLVTVLFADLAGFTAMAERMDPEEVREVLAPYFARWREAIERQGGMVEKYIGDAVMAVFGLPTAHEDDTERAIHAALQMRLELVIINQVLELEHGVRLVMRVGIHTGPVVASLVEDGKEQRFGVVGDTVNLAARLQESAPEDGILISHDTYRHVRGVFSARALEPLMVKGKTRPVQAYIVLRAKPRAFHMETRGVQGVETRMVGRQHEMRVLQDAVRAATQGGTLQAITVMGDAGVGKSRLMYEFDNWLELIPEYLFYLKGRATAANQATQYALLRDLVAYRFQIQENDPPVAVQKRLEEGIAAALRLPAGSEKAVTRAALIGTLLGYEMDQTGMLTQSADPGVFFQRAVAALVDFFRGLSSESPVVVLLENVHWADESSLEVLDQISKTLSNKPLLLVSTARPQLFETYPEWGAGRDFHKFLWLAPLSTAESRELVGEILQKVEMVPAALRELVVGNAEGNPFFIEELIKMLIEDGAIQMGVEHWHVEAERLVEVSVPPSLVELLQSRFDRLTSPERLALQRAAVVGRVFWDQAVAALDARPEGSLPPGQIVVTQVLENLEKREMVKREEASAFTGTAQYHFHHILLRDVVYESVLKRERRLFHARAARWLEQAASQSLRQDEFASSIAAHLEQAGAMEQCVAWYQHAGDHAQEHFSNGEAVRCYSRALALIPAENTLKRYELLLRREHVLHIQGRRSDQWQDLESLRSLAIDLDGANAQSGPFCSAEVALRRAGYHDATGDYTAAIAAARQAVELAEQARAVNHQTHALLAVGRSLWRQGEYAEASEQLREALELARRDGQARAEAEGLRMLGLVLVGQGRYSEGLECFDQSRKLFHKLNDRLGEANGLNAVGAAYYTIGDMEQSGVFHRKALDAFTQLGDRRGQGLALNNLGVVYQAQGDHASAKEYYLQALEVNEEIADLGSMVSTLNNLGTAAQALGDFKTAQSCYQRMLDTARQIEEVPGQAASLSNLGWLGLQMGELAAAKDWLEQALHLTRRMRNYDLEAHVFLRLGRLFQALGRLVLAESSLRRSLALRRWLDRPILLVEPLASLAEVICQRGRPEDAGAFALEAAGLLEQYGESLLDPSDDLYGTYLACTSALRLADPTRAEALLATAREMLAKQASVIHGEAAREQFLSGSESHRRLADAFSTDNHSPIKP